MASTSSSSSAVLIEGYLEKKKRRALQGYAKRYFILDNNGTLSYSRVQGEKTRDSVDLRKCSVGRSKKRRHLVIDSGDRVPWHCKALSDKDFERWTAAFHNFAQVNEEETRNRSKSLSITNTSRTTATGQHHVQDRLVNDKHASELVQLIAQMTPNINALAKIAAAKQQEHQQKEQQSSGFGVSSIVGAVGSVAATVTGSASTAVADAAQEAQELGKHVASLRRLHQRAVDLLQNTHMAPDRQSSDSLDRAESIYHDAQSAGSTYELDEDDMLTSDSASSVSDSSSLDSFSSSTSDDDSSAYESGEEGSTDDDAASSASDRTQHGPSQSSKPVKRRTRLPHPIAGNEVSLFSLLKKNMGKDLSKVAFPVSMNEPISGLESMAESLQYTELLDQAAKMSDSSERLLYVTVFAITTYAKYKYRSSRKPFNPMMGETYELVRPDKGLKFVSEKVSHHPNWLACFAEGKGWDYTATESGQQKFWGRSMEILPEGIAEIRLKETGELYTFSRPPSYIRNIMSGEKYIEHVGELEVSNTDTGEYARVNFKEGSSWGGASSRNKIEGTIYDANDKEKIHIQGKWDEYISRKTGGKSSETIWQIADFPEDAPKWYGFSEWTTQLNEITPDIKDYLPPTDSRLRPDQRAFENGDVDTADVEKQQLEAKQRERRKKWETAPDDSKPPQFFEEEDDGVWHYRSGPGAYWERREKKAWNKDIQVFEL